MAKRLIFLKSYNNFDLFGVYKDNKFLYRITKDRFDLKKEKKQGEKNENT